MKIKLVIILVVCIFQLTKSYSAISKFIPINFEGDTSQKKTLIISNSIIQFEFDSSVITTKAIMLLDAVAAELKLNPGILLTINGYCSSEGTAAHNMRLGRDRANSVKTYLYNANVAANRLKVKSYGELRPVADNSTEAGRILNRRVEFVENKSENSGDVSATIKTTPEIAKKYLVNFDFYNTYLINLSAGKIIAFLDENPALYCGNKNTEFKVRADKYMAIILYKGKIKLIPFSVYENRTNTLNEDLTDLQ